MFDRFDPNIGNEIGELVLSRIQAALQHRELPTITRNYIGMGPVPAEDCCPDLVGWVTNLRLWDGISPDSLRENRVVHGLFGISFDFNVRLGLCYLEGDGEGAFDSATIDAQSQNLNKYGFVAYLAAVDAFTDFTYNCGGDRPCEIDVLPQPMFPYNQGACAGWNMVFSISIL